jgi:hypothetical protein
MRRGKVTYWGLTDLDRACAWHEAGHAAAYLWLDVPIVSASIVADGESQGSVTGRPMPRFVTEWVESRGSGAYRSPPLRVRDRIEREIIILFAGEVAQEKATGTTEGSAVTIEHSEHGTVIVDGDWHRVFELAEVVAPSEEELGPYLDWLLARTRGLLNQPQVWVTVEALADALLAHGRLNRRQILEARRGRLHQGVGAGH